MKDLSLRAKSESKDFIKKCIIAVQTQFNCKIKFVRHDCARKFATTSLKVFNDDQRIEQQVTILCAHQN